jgi:molecular chaperone DnaK (HSP70)
LATSGDRTLGGLDFDMALSDHFAAELKVGKFKVDVSKNKRAQIRLLKECERLKKLMSSNATKMSMNVECIMDDKDVSGHMKRDEFEQICETKGYLNQFRAVLNDALKQLNPKYTINFVEMVGGSYNCKFKLSKINKRNNSNSSSLRYF